MKKILLLLLVLPGLVFAKDTARLRRTVYEKLKVDPNTGFYKDSLVNNEIQQATGQVANVTGCMLKTDTIICPSNVFRRIIGKDSGLKVIAVYKRLTYGGVSNLAGLSETTEKLFGMVNSATPQFVQDRSGDSLVVMIQPTPKTAESLWVKYTCYGKRYDTLWTGGGDSMQVLNPENPLPASFEGLVVPLVAARLLSRESPYRNDVMELLYREYLQAAAFLPDEMIKRVSDLWALPAYIQQTGGDKPR